MLFTTNSPLSCYLVPLWHRHLPQHPILDRIWIEFCKMLNESVFLSPIPEKALLFESYLASPKNV